METAVRKATRLEYRPPKEKHLLTLKNLTFESPAIIDGILMNLEKRLKERSWIITYKVLAIIHYLMREGNSVPVIDAVLRHPSVLDTSRIKNKSHASTNVQNIYAYRAYLDERVIAFRHLKRDYAAESSTKEEAHLRRLQVKDGLLRETTALQRQMESALKCKFHLDENDPQITLFVYKMVIEDLLALFKALNEGVVNILEHYFEMNKSDATTALEIYKTFAQLVELTIAYLNEARKLETNNIQLEIPPIKHAPLSLAAALEDYLNDQLNNDGQAASVSRNNPAQRPPHSVNQPTLPQSMQQPIIQQQQHTLAPIQNNTFSAQQANMDTAFSIVNRQSTFSLPPQQRISASPQSSFAVQNPFLDNTTLPISQSPSRSNNPFRSMSMLSPSGHNASLGFNLPSQQIIMAPHHQQILVQPQVPTSSLNPFASLSPTNPPLNSFTNPPYASNPFMTQ